jgi:hypothetical protein
MSSFLNAVILSATQAQTTRLSAAEKANIPESVQIGTVSGFNSDTGEYSTDRRWWGTDGKTWQFWSAAISGFFI